MKQAQAVSLDLETAREVGPSNPKFLSNEVKPILEVHHQLKGERGHYQLSNRPTVGATVNMGGNDKSVVAPVLCAGA